MAAKRLLELFVSRLSFYTTEESFREMFSPYGVIRQARLVKDPRTGRSKGFGFVAYESEDEALNALKAMNGRIINNRLFFCGIREFRGERRQRRHLKGVLQTLISRLDVVIINSRLIFVD